MFRLSVIKKIVLFSAIISLLVFPAFVEAGGGHGGKGGMGGGGHMSSYGNYYTPSVNTAAWRTGSLLGYPTGLSGGLYSPYLGGLGGYSLGGYGGYPYYGGLGGGGWGYPSSSSTKYSVTQSNTIYGPTGSVTNSLSQSQAYQTYPWSNYGLGGIGLGGYNPWYGNYGSGWI